MGDVETWWLGQLAPLIVCSPDFSDPWASSIFSYVVLPHSCGHADWVREAVDPNA